MLTLKAQVEAACLVAFQAVVGDCEDFIVVVTPSTQPQFGHYQCNSAMPLAKKLKKSPRDIATEIVTSLASGSNQHLFERLDVAGPGFINIWLSCDYVKCAANALLADKRLGVAAVEKPSRIVIDFSSPNVAKEMHVGHLRSTIIGDCIARVLSHLGHDVVRLNHVGDWGTAFGMLIAYVSTHEPEVLSGKRSAELPDLMRWYRAAKKEFDQDMDFQNRSRQQVVALQGGDPVARKAWQLICDVSYQAYSEIYDLLDIEITNRGESFYNDQLPGVVLALQEKNMVEESDGAKCVFLPGFKNKDNQPLPLIVQKKDGGFNYTTTDLAALKHRVEQEHADRIIYVTDAGQALHFKMFFACAEKAGFYDAKKLRLDHVPFGLVLGHDGKKLKSRSGEVERLIDLLTKAIDKAADIFSARHEDWSDEQCHQAAKVLGLAAVKYADLSIHRTSDYQFSYDKMLSFEGNTAAFILYAYVRCQSIFRKVDGAPSSEIAIQETTEMDLAIHLLSFSQVLQLVSEQLTPNRLTDYLYQLAGLFNAFFRDCRVEGAPEQASRLRLVGWTADVLAQGLALLGIQVLDKM